MKHTSDKAQEIAHKILAYLMDNPDAQDTLEGIVEWWLLQEDIKRNVALIRKAVDGLIQKGFLLEREGNGRTKCYLVNRKRLPEVSALIKHDLNTVFFEKNRAAPAGHVTSKPSQDRKGTKEEDDGRRKGKPQGK